MKKDGDGKGEPAANNPEKLPELIELELLQKRAAWERARARRNSLRAMSFLFLFVVMVAAIGGFYYVTSIMERPALPREVDAVSTPTPSVAPSR